MSCPGERVSGMLKRKSNEGMIEKIKGKVGPPRKRSVLPLPVLCGKKKKKKKDV